MANDDRGRERSRPRQAAPAVAARADRLHRELTGLVRELALLLDVPLEGPEAVEQLDLRLRLPLRRRRDEAGPGAALLDAIADELRSAAETNDALRPGRAFCFQCRSSDCPHAAPPDDRAVFVAYAATGKPIWRELTEACLHWGVPRVDALYGDPPGVVAIVRSARELTAELLAGFGRGERSYRLLGQVALGYLLLGGGANDRRRAALTLQVIGVRRPHGGVQLHLNVIGTDSGAAGRSGYPEWWGRSALREAVREARSDLQSLSLRVSGKRRGVGAVVDEGVEAVLGRLRSAVERAYRPQQHRTRHAVARQQEGRPTHTALADAERVPDDRLLYEPERDTFIVLGPKGRVHVFAEDARHVTSLHHNRDSIDRKLDRKQWVPAEGARRDRFRDAVAARLAGRRS